MLLPALFQNQDDMPMSLGKAIARAIAPKADPFAAFEGYVHAIYDPKSGKYQVIDEQDCRQIKGAAQEHALGAGTDLASAPVAVQPSAQKFKVFDRVRLVYGEGIVKTGTVTATSVAFHGEWCCTTDDGEFGVFRPDQMVHLAPEPAATPVALGDGWIEWGGGGCPLIECATRIEVRFRDGDTMQVDARTLEPRNWLHCWDSGNIIAYRVLGAA